MAKNHSTTIRQATHSNPVSMSQTTLPSYTRNNIQMPKEIDGMKVIGDTKMAEKVLANAPNAQNQKPGSTIRS